MDVRSLSEERPEPTEAKRALATIVIPAYNEGDALRERLETLVRALAASQSGYEFEFLVVDDGSADGTYEIARATASAIENLRVVRHDANQGLGAALRTGFAEAGGSVVVTFDSDLSYPPELISDLLLELDRTRADLVLASAYMPGGSVTGVPLFRRILSREANRFLSFATGGRYATVTCMVRAYRAEFFKAIETTENRMEINPELFFKALKRGAVVSEIPAQLRWSPERAQTNSRVNIARTYKQILRTLGYGIRYRPAVLLALPGILPGVLPLIVAVMALLRLDLRTIAVVTIVTMVIQNASLALFAGQLGSFAFTVRRRKRTPA